MFLLESVFRFVAPYDCLVCGREGELVCKWCLPDVCTPVPSRCYHCRAATTDSTVCDKCRKHTTLRHVWIAAFYEETVKALIHQYKFERAKSVGFTLAKLLGEAAPYFPEDTVVTYIPTASSRIRDRGYDQAEVLAREFAKLRKLPFKPLLHRSGQTRQVGAGRNERLSQLASAFTVKNEPLVRGARIILVDDIVTTGATLESAGRTLKTAGAKSVNGLAVAQKQ